MSTDIGVFGLKLDKMILQTISLSLLHLARGDSFEEMKATKVAAWTNWTELLIKDESGRKLISSKGAGYWSIAIVYAVLDATGKIPENVRPVDDEGRPLTNTDMTESILKTCLHVLKSLESASAVEGPKRNVAAEK